MKSTINPGTENSVYTQTGETTWIVDLEEDPESGDLIMPIPLEALEANGWKIGDTLTWEVGTDGEVTLSKQTSA